MKDSLDGHHSVDGDGQIKHDCAHSEVEHLAEGAGELVYNWGLKRVHGRIWTHMFLASSPLDAAALVERLQISKALVSISLREMMNFRLIVSAGKSPQGTFLYDVNHDFFAIVLALLNERGKVILEQLAGAQQDLANALPLKAECGLADAKVQQMGELIEKASGWIEAILEKRNVKIPDFTDGAHPTQT